nr:ATP-binding protein [Streptomyces sp. HNM0574]
MFAAQVVLVAVVVAGCAVFAYVTDKAQAENAARHRAGATAAAVAHSPSVREAVRTAEPAGRLQEYAREVRRDTGVTFITIMSVEGTRWTHPDPRQLGKRFVGHIGPATRGETFDETYTGTLGPSVRVVTPVTDDEGRVVALVAAGITVETISAQLRHQVTLLLGVAAGALLLGGLGAWWTHVRLRRHTHRMNAVELRRMREYHQAALHAVREGLLLLDGAHRVALINDGARDLLGLTAPGPGPVGRPVPELGLPPSLTAALLDGEPRVDEVHLTADRVVLLSTSPVSGGHRSGTVVTLRDHTALQSLAGELDSVRGVTEALRSQAHEAANRLHTVVSLIELGRTDDAVDFATEELELAQALTDQVVSAVGEPVLAALLLGKAAQANERGIELRLSPDSHIEDAWTAPEAGGAGGAGRTILPARDLVTVVGNLIDNALDAVGDGPGRDVPRVTVTVRTEDGVDGAVLLVRVADSGPGVGPGEAEAVFERGWSTKPHAAGGRGLGLALVRQTAHRYGGSARVGQAAEGGAEFTVRLPLTGPPAARDEDARAGTRPSEEVTGA